MIDKPTTASCPKTQTNSRPVRRDVSDERCLGLVRATWSGRSAPGHRRRQAVALLFGLIASGQIQLRRIDGYQRLSEVLEHAEVAA